MRLGITLGMLQMYCPEAVTNGIAMVSLVLVKTGRAERDENCGRPNAKSE
jgi:hypothetical protein